MTIILKFCLAVGIFAVNAVSAANVPQTLQNTQTVQSQPQTAQSQPQQNTVKSSLVGGLSNFANEVINENKNELTTALTANLLGVQLRPPPPPHSFYGGYDGFPQQQQQQQQQILGTQLQPQYAYSGQDPNLQQVQAAPSVQVQTGPSYTIPLPAPLASPPEPKDLVHQLATRNGPTGFPTVFLSNPGAELPLPVPNHYPTL